MGGDEVIHFARLDAPAEAFRTACGAWRSARNWTSVPRAVTCPACRERTAAARSKPQPAAGGAEALAPHPAE